MSVSPPTPLRNPRRQPNDEFPVTPELRRIPARREIHQLASQRDVWETYGIPRLRPTRRGIRVTPAQPRIHFVPSLADAERELVKAEMEEVKKRSVSRGMQVWGILKWVLRKINDGIYTWLYLFCTRRQTRGRGAFDWRF